MGKIDLSKYNQLEQMSQHDLNMLEQAIVEVCFKDHVVENIFVIGSFVFGLDKINDIDIVVCIKDPISQDSLEEDNVKLYSKFQNKYSNKLSKRFNVKISLMPFNIMDFMTDEVKTINPPMYDLTNRIWINKEPGTKWNYLIVKLDTGKVVLWDRDKYLCEGKICTCG
tara:strand:+ start:80 stop:583 length:504 start_codon:yes stop_codon:yes gene_type:complete